MADSIHRDQQTAQQPDRTLKGNNLGGDLPGLRAPRPGDNLTKANNTSRNSASYSIYLSQCPYHYSSHRHKIKRNSSTTALKPIFARTDTYKSSNTISLWNNLPDDVRACSSLQTFKYMSGIIYSLLHSL